MGNEERYIPDNCRIPSDLLHIYHIFHLQRWQRIHIHQLQCYNFVYHTRHSYILKNYNISYCDQMVIQSLLKCFGSTPAVWLSNEAL